MDGGHPAPNATREVDQKEIEGLLAELDAKAATA
jgi:hypothetical protein